MRLKILLSLVVLTACAAPYRDTRVAITSQKGFVAERYLGRWYEIARFPVSFQKGCTATTADYGRIDADTISVKNTCRQGSPDGEMRSISGTADIIGPGRLKVRFNNVPFIAAPYWVLWVDEGYETAVVGVPNGRAGWILARAPIIDADRRVKAEQILRANGYDVTALIDVQQTIE
ncbi:Outer membrane lipoprotein Blc [Roseobacter fucihabitans]|uniref:Outer membrane lipoprotein Blc n=1 Tax=Roseobacter fucihabitans TaxID=1537242 RepID=A0ABZ2C0E1_9RHOB|nr:lipocalin family protein [Roseobacter litoralis]MBC6966852.1 Outer membrane lipoprotein Blc precursor [Roseobacter litoralis]